MDPMHLSQQAALQYYLNLGADRSLVRTAKEFQWRGTRASPSTLKRWSRRFGWQRLVAQHDAQLGEELVRRSVLAQADQLYNDLKAVAWLKGRFADRAKLDPADPNLTKVERRRVVDPNLRDYLKLLRWERELRADLIAGKVRKERLIATPGQALQSEENAIPKWAYKRWGLPE